MVSAAALLLAALAEIGGCFAVWSVLRSGASAWWLAAGAAALAVFAVALTVVPSVAAGRVFAAYGGVYVAASLGWLALVEGRPLGWGDWVGGALCVVGAAVVLGFAPRGG